MVEKRSLHCQTTIWSKYFVLFLLLCALHTCCCFEFTQTNSDRAPNQWELGANICLPPCLFFLLISLPRGIMLTWTLQSSSLTSRQQRQTVAKSELTVLIRGAMRDVISPLIITQTEGLNCDKQKGCQDSADVNINLLDFGPPEWHLAIRDADCG